MVIEPPAARRIRGAKMPLPATSAVPARPRLRTSRRRRGRLSSLFGVLGLVAHLIPPCFCVSRINHSLARSDAWSKRRLEGFSGLVVEQMQMARRGPDPAGAADRHREIRRLADVDERIAQVDRDERLVAERLDDIDLAGKRIRWPPPRPVSACSGRKPSLTGPAWLAAGKGRLPEAWWNGALGRSRRRGCSSAASRRRWRRRGSPAANTAPPALPAAAACP